MNSKMSVIFLCIVLVAAIVFGGILISSVSDNINKFKAQIDNTSAYFSHKLPGNNSDSGNIEPEN